MDRPILPVNPPRFAMSLGEGTLLYKATLPIWLPLELLALIQIFTINGRRRMQRRGTQDDDGEWGAAVAEYGRAYDAADDFTDLTQSERWGGGAPRSPRFPEN